MSPLSSTPVLLQEAMALHQQGQWPEAEAAYRRALDQDPKNADALALLGGVLSEQKKHEEAIARIEEALRLDPQAALFHFHLGNALDKAEQHDRAEAALACATALAPNFAEAWYNLGNAQRAQNKKDAAKASYEKTLALDPKHALAYNNLGLLLWKKGELPAARKRFEEGLKHHPAHVGLLLNLNGICFELNDLPTAFSTARRVAEIKLKIPPGENYLERPDLFRKLDEETSNCLLALAVSAMLQGKYEESSAVLRGLLAEEPDMAEAFSGLGSLALANNNMDAAEEAYMQGFTFDPVNTTAPWNRAMALLTRGNLREGFRRYRWRWHALEKFRNMRLNAPMWDGSPLQGKTILVHEEQGFGDSIQMLRFLPLLKEKGARTYFYARPVLFPLVENAPGVDRVFSWDVAEKNVPPEVDYTCGAMDLPGLLGIGLNNIPARVPYLANPRAGDPAFRLEGSARKIGLVWAGNPQHKRDHERSVPLEMFQPLIEPHSGESRNPVLPSRKMDPGLRRDEGVSFYSLQYKPKEADQKLMEKWGIIDLAPRIKNLADQAGFMAQLDLLITIDSAPAHLAGALGVPVWVLVTCNPDWRWLLGRDDSPWYPSLRLFRQPVAGNWKEVIEMVKSVFSESKDKLILNR